MILLVRLVLFLLIPSSIVTRDCCPRSEPNSGWILLEGNGAGSHKHFSDVLAVRRGRRQKPLSNWSYATSHLFTSTSLAAGPSPQFRGKVYTLRQHQPPWSAAPGTPAGIAERGNYSPSASPWSPPLPLSPFVEKDDLTPAHVGFDKGKGVKGRAPAFLGRFGRERRYLLGRPDGTSHNKDDSGDCRATTERLDLHLDGSFLLRNSNPTPNECINKLEPLNPRLPFVGDVTQRCATHMRRWPKFWQHVKRTTMEVADGWLNVQLLATACPERMFRPALATDSRTVANETAPKMLPMVPRRLVFIDAGCRNFNSSTRWFLQTYPGAERFDIHAFDVVERHTEDFARYDPTITFHHAAIWNESGFVSFPSASGVDVAHFHKSLRDRPPFEIVGPYTTVPAVDFAAFLLAETSPDDYVVVKIDVEGIEFMLFEHLSRRGALSRVDEVFLECHNAEWVPGWAANTSLADCHRLFNTLRASGVYAHEWY